MRSVASRSVAGAASLLATTIVVACAATPPTRSGGTEPVRTLTAATYFPTGYPSGDTLDHLVRQLDGSDGVTARVHEITTTANEDPGSDALRLVRDGDLDLAVVPTRVFDLVGATSFQALQAPLHFVSVEQADAVLTDPVADRMLAPLEDLGLHPLALAFDAFRNVKGYHGPLVKPADFAGKQVAARPSRATAMTIEALGASVYPKVGRPFEEDVAAGLVAGLEDSINQSNLEGSGISVANEILSFKANVIVVNADVWRTMSVGQRSALEDAAASAREFSITDMAYHLDLATAAVRYCAEGHGDVVLASASDLAAMRAALRPVDDALRADSVTSAAIDRIDELAVEHPQQTPVRPCRAQDPAQHDYSPVVPLGDQSVLDGTWRIDVSLQLLLDAGVTPTDASNNAGIWTFVFDNGHLTATKEGQAPCEAELRIRGTRLSVIFDETTGCGGDFTSRFRRDGDRVLLDQCAAADDYSAAFYDAFYSQGVTRIGP